MSKVAIAFDDLTEFFAIRSDIDALMRENIIVDIYVIPSYSREMQEKTQRIISQLGYLVKDIATSTGKYKILLEPYRLVDKKDLNFEFRIKYSYSVNSAKPNPVHTPKWNLPYDVSISYSKRDAEIKSAYGKAYVVEYSKYKNFKKEKHKGKPRLLYLPTFGEVGSISALSDKVLTDLKKKYKLVIKAHHAVQYREGERDNYNYIKRVADEFYDSDTPIENLLAHADIVLSDNSAAIFEAIYSGTPVAVFSDKLNERRLGGINTFQYELVRDGVIPCATKPEDITEALGRAVKLKEKQNKVKNQYFSADKGDSLSDFTEIIKLYLSKNREEDVYLASRDVLVSSISALNDDIDRLRHKIEELEARNRRLYEKTLEYENSNSWKVTRPLREINRLRRRKDENK